MFGRTYKCVCKIDVRIVVFISDKGIDAFKHGFWANQDWQFTTGADNKYWVSPSTIQYIEKI